MPPHLGTFQLDEEIGRGGMGKVFRARHRLRGEKLLVAIKVLTLSAKREAEFQAFFAREVATLATLDHPCVVRLYDHGRVPDEPWVSALNLRPGAPWLAMELGRHGTLADCADRIQWPQIRSTLLAVLDALGHAHAQRIVHRDLKPANVLLDGAGGALLTDFGLANLLEHTDLEDDKAAGTPMYMAPEQILGAVRDVGPWTDLYALGVLGWRLATGSTPFKKSGDVSAVLDMHLYDDLPAYRPRTPCPIGFEHWLRRLLEKSIRGRFRRAADAAHVLRALPVSDFSAVVASIQSLEVHEDDLTLPMTSGNQAELITPRLDDFRTTLRLPPMDQAAGLVELPVLGDWRRTRPRRRGPLSLRGAGLGLVGLRRLPMVGREDERDALWSALKEVSERRRPQASVICGGAGFGKTRLSEWLGERAHEVGAATVLRALHDPVGGPSHGLGVMIGRHFRCLGVGRVETAARVEQVLQERRGDVPVDEARALVELIRPAPADAPGAFWFAQPRERWVLIERIIDDLLVERPVVLHLDDAQWGADALGFAHYLLREDAPGRALLIVVTVRDDLIVDRPAEHDALKTLLALDTATEHSLGPIESEHREALVRSMLGLEPRLASLVAARSGGNPLFARQIVEDWVERGILVDAAKGYRLAEDATGELPVDLRAVWSTRLARLLEEKPAEWRIALELGAALGQQVDFEEWSALCSAQGFDAPAAAVDALVAHGLATWSADSEGWGFAHGMLRECVEVLAADAGRRSEHHRACHRVLDGRGEASFERLARHLLAAGEREAALQPLKEAVDVRGERGEGGLAAALTDEYRAALTALGVPDSDPRWIWTRMRAISSLRIFSSFDEAQRLALQVIDEAENAGELALAAAARYERAVALWHSTRLAEAEAEARRAIHQARAAGDDVLEARCSLGFAGILWRQGRQNEAEEPATAALEAFRSAGQLHGETSAMKTLCIIARQQGNLELATSRATETLELARRHGFRSLANSAWNILGEAHRLSGRLEEAADCYRRAMELVRALGSPYGLAPATNLGMTMAEMGRYAEARRALDASVARSTRMGMKGTRICALLNLLVCDAGEGQWGQWDEHLSIAQHLLQRTGFLESDCPRSLHLAGRLAAEEGELERAQGALRLAVEQWLVLERPEDAAEVRDELQRL